MTFPGSREAHVPERREELSWKCGQRVRGRKWDCASGPRAADGWANRASEGKVQYAPEAMPRAVRYMKRPYGAKSDIIFMTAL